MNAYHDHEPEDAGTPDAIHGADEPPPAVRDNCYVLRDEAGRESLVTYDGENPLAWMQSSTWLDLSDVL